MTASSKKISNIAQVRVRYAETDKMQVVYNANYFIYLEVARNELVRNKNFSFSNLEIEEKVFFPIIDTYAKFNSPAFYDDILDIETVICYDESPIFKIEYKIFCQKKLICEAYTRHTFISQASRRPVKPPARFIALFD